MMFLAILSAALVIASVAIHLAFLKGLLSLLPRLHFLGPLSLGVMVVGAVVAHLVEIALFGIVLFYLSTSGSYGAIAGTTGAAGDWSAHFYYSAVTYTSLGFGDLTPTDDYGVSLLWKS